MSVWNNQSIVDLLVSLWDEGRTGTEIAQTIEVRFGVLLTRNAVIAKLDRLGKIGSRANGRGQQALSRAQKDARQKKVRQTLAANALAAKLPVKAPEPPKPQGWFAMQSKPVEVKPYVEKQLAYMPTAEQMLTIHDLEEHHCRFPINDPRTPEFRYCGGVKVLSQSYCSEHCRIAYATPEIAPAYEEAAVQPVAVKREVVDA